MSAGAGEGAAIVFCERLDNESFCESVVRELARHHEVRPCGPGWPAADLAEVDLRDARFYLELDAASGSFVRPTGLDRLRAPKFAWLIDTHKKPTFHRELSAAPVRRPHRRRVPDAPRGRGLQRSRERTGVCSPEWDHRDVAAPIQHA